MQDTRKKERKVRKKQMASKEKSLEKDCQRVDKNSS